MERYERLKILGVGSFGKVYLMRHRQERLLVCAKIIKIKNMPRKERDACRTEVELLRRLHHPNIVSYKDSFLTPRKDHLCIVMEYCDGGDLSTQIKNARRRLFPESKILHWFVQIALGLHYMHGRRVLHRDLKTQNIFLLGNGRLVLGDFGISKVLEGTMDFASTRIGTPYYMSPEIFNNKPYNHKSDIWALGCVLYEMTALSHAFDASSLNELANKIAKGRYPPIHVKYSRNLRELIGRMLSTSSAERPDLDQILQLGFIKKHIHNFLVDIVSRESHKMGEGTMVFKAAAISLLADAEGSQDTPRVAGVGAIALSALGSNPDMLALKRQMEELGLQEELKRALNIPETLRPTTAGEAAKAAKEQASALRREEDRRKAVESALQRLRNEREERLRLRHGRAGGLAMPPPPPPPPSQGAIDASPNVTKDVASLHSGVVGVGVATRDPVSSRGVPTGASVARQTESASVRRLQVGARELSRAAAPKVAGPGSAAPSHRREGRRSLEPRERRDDARSKDSFRLQRRSSFAGDARGNRGSAREVVAGAEGGGSGRERKSLPDPTEVMRVKELDKFGRARESERLAAEAMLRREVAQSRDAARKREEVNQRERERDRDRLRQDKVELDRKMMERQRLLAYRRARLEAEEQVTSFLDNRREQERQRLEAEEKKKEREKQQFDCLEIASLQEAAAAAAALTATGAGAIPPLPPPPLVPRSRRRWVQAGGDTADEGSAALARLAHRGSGGGKERESDSSSRSPAALATAKEVLERRKQEKASLEEAVKRRETEKNKRPQQNAVERVWSHDRLNAPLPPQSTESNRGYSVGVYPPHHSGGKSGVSAATSTSEDSDDSDGTIGWERPGERYKEGKIEVGGGSPEGPSSCADEADEDIHAREGQLEVELQVATMRCEELRHTLKNTKAMIPAVAGSNVGPSCLRGGVPHRSKDGMSGDANLQLGSLEDDDADNDDNIEDNDSDMDRDDSNQGGSRARSGSPMRQRDNHDLPTRPHNDSRHYKPDSSRRPDDPVASNTRSSSGVSSSDHGGKRPPHADTGSGLRGGAAVGAPVPASMGRLTDEREYDEALVPGRRGGVAEGSRCRGREAGSQRSIAAAGAAEVTSAPGKGVPREASESPPPPPPTGRLADRIRVLRERCHQGLGSATFERAYRYLKAQEDPDLSEDEGGGGDASMGDDREERHVRGLTDILGENKLHYYSLIDQLIFIENTHMGPR